MLEAIRFNKPDVFVTKDFYNEMTDLTNNTIIICNSVPIHFALNDEILNTINGTAEYNDYACDESDVGTGKVLMLGGLQRMLSIGDQTITTGIEPALVYKAKSDEDIWFADTIITEDGKEKILIYPMTHFKGHKDVWSEGLDSVYFYVAGGRYGAYDGTCWNYFNKK
jgi:hypothetical protein